jgi:hypothetical protein
MTDRELLELAAKAAGYESLVDQRGTWYKIDGDWVDWNPLFYERDALRLAIKLGLKIMPYPVYGVDKHSVIVSKRVPATDPESEVAYVGPECVELYHESDPYTATCRAVVRAAAELAA